jgi:hypothetical protein
MFVIGGADLRANFWINGVVAAAKGNETVPQGAP